MRDTLTSGKFWLGLILGLAILAAFPQLSPRVSMTTSTGRGGGL